MPYKDPEKRKEYRKEYLKTEKGKKSRRISDWKRMGLVADYDKLYDKYISITHCELCNIELTIGRYTKSTTRCLDHDHKTGLFRNVVCHSCNIRRETNFKQWDKKEYDKKKYHYQKSWGGEKQNNNNLLKININLFI